MIILYVDAFGTADNSVAVTINPLCITYNLDVLYTISLEKYSLDQDKTKQPTPVFAAGKYVCALFRLQEADTMMFFDFKKNRELLNRIISKYDFGSKKDLFIQIFEKVTLDYDSNLNSVKLVIGIPPRSDTN